jgi:hypothetical protein
MIKTLTLMFLGVCGSALAQQPDLEAQRAAMKKLDFLVGKWSGPATVTRGPGQDLKIVQTEDVQFKLQGLALLIEGIGLNAEGKRVFGALTVIVFDDATNTYRFHAHNDGRYLDTELKVSDNGFSWGYVSGSVKVVNTMKVSGKGEWLETTDSTYWTQPAQRLVDMKLQRQ